jgi:Domain of unknown function (DUF1127)
MPAAFSKNESDALDARRERFVSSAASQSCREIFGHRLPRAIRNARALQAALSFLRTHLGGPAKAFAAEFGVRCAINHLRSLDDHRLRDLGLRREEIEHFVRFGRDER